MKKTILTAILALAVSFNTIGAFAAGVGYVDYSKISTQYSLSKKYTAELDKKIKDLDTYIAAQETKIKAAKTAAEKKTLGTNAQKQIQTKKQEYVTLRNKYEAELKTKLQEAAEKVRVQKKLDIIIRKDTAVTGGVDCTQDILNILK